MARQRSSVAAASPMVVGCRGHPVTRRPCCWGTRDSCGRRYITCGSCKPCASGMTDCMSHKLQDCKFVIFNFAFFAICAANVDCLVARKHMESPTPVLRGGSSTHYTPLSRRKKKTLETMATVENSSCDGKMSICGSKPFFRRWLEINRLCLNPLLTLPPK